MFSSWRFALILVVTAFPVLADSGYLGLHMVDIDSNHAAALHLKEESGVYITGVVDNGPAERAGIRAGDALLAYNGETILGAQQLQRLVGETPIGRKVKVDLWRNARAQSVQVLVSPFPAVTRELTGNGAGLVSLDVPDFSGPVAADIPAALLVWKNGLLGLESEDLSPQMAQSLGVAHGVLVRWVQPGGSAANAGIKAADIIISIEDRSLNTVRDLSSFCRGVLSNSPTLAGRSTPVRPFSVSLMRDHKPLTLRLSFPE